jgi:hypothetical protein
MQKMPAQITYLPHAAIDKQKWDACIDQAANGLIYPYSFYLDAMSKNWDALVMGDYEALMPLTWNRKYGIYYLYQPFFAAHLGVFGNYLSATLVREFLEAVPEKFRYWDIYLNKANLYPVPGFKLYERSNYVLSLYKSYAEISLQYAKSHVRNIRKASEAGNIVQENIPVSDVISLAMEQSKNFSPVSQKDYQNFSALFSILLQKGHAITIGVYSSQQQLVASCGWFFSHGRAYYILVGNHPNGRTSGASHLMIDHFIKKYAGTRLLLDFEGSDIRNLAWFYSSFGATEEKYPGIKMNKLSAVAKLFKK